MFETNAKLPNTMGLVSTLQYFQRINFIHLHCSYQKEKLQHAAVYDVKFRME